MRPLKGSRRAVAHPFQLVPGLLGSAKIAILTVTVEEFDIVRGVFELAQNIPATPYFVADEHAQKHDVVIRRIPHQTNLISMESTSGFILDFRPEFIFLIGTAGGYYGRDSLRLGDVVVGNYVEFSGYWKYKEGQILRRKIPHDPPSLYLFENFLEPIRACPECWRPNVAIGRPEPGEPSLIPGEIISGDELLGDPNNAEQKRVLEFFDKALAFEMEAVGVARAVHKARQWVTYNPQYAVLRGICDPVNTNAEGNQQLREQWTPYAVNTAAAVAAVLAERILRAIEARNDSLAVKPGVFARLKGYFNG